MDRVYARSKKRFLAMLPAPAPWSLGSNSLYIRIPRRQRVQVLKPEGVAQFNLMCILNLQPLHKAQSIGKPMKRPSAHTDATEHAYDDNTGPRGSDATERAATTPTHTPAAGDIEMTNVDGTADSLSLIHI